MREKKKLLLINPVSQLYRITYYHFVTKIPPLACMILAALTPKKDWTVKIIDEQVEKVDYDQAVDLIGITSMSLVSNRCYQIADNFRSRGIPVIIGGIHASMLPDEAAMHADSVLIGEAEEIWENILNDFLENRLKSRYQAQRFTPMETHYPLVRYDLVNPKKYIAGIIQTSRGCPFNCEFCSVTAYLGSKLRQRSVEDVIKDIEATPHRYILTADDNFFGYSRKEMDRAIAIMQELVKRRIKKTFYVQASVNFTEHEDVLYWAHKSGIKIVCLGLESLNADVIKGKMNKAANVKFVESKYRDVIKKLHKANIIAKGTLIYNNDEETFGSIIDLINDVRASELDIISIRSIIPLPGTALYYRLKQENRLLIKETPENWERLEFIMTHRTDAIQSYDDAIKIRSYILKTLYIKKVLVKRTIRSFLRVKILNGVIFCLANSMANKKTHEFFIGLQKELAEKERVKGK